MKPAMIIRTRYIVIIFILVISLCTGSNTCFLASPEGITISEVKTGENGELLFSAEVQGSKWFDYVGIDSEAKWIENEKGEKEKALVCCLYKYLKIGGTGNKKKSLSASVDLSEAEGVSAIYFERKNDRVLVWREGEQGL